MIEQQNTINLSVIVPCYNVEQYLDQSLRCLERQWENRTDYEIILVNDGSKDGTINKLKDFKAHHPEHVKLIDKRQNVGLAAARNSAMEIARGKWIAFFDPDDLLAEGSYAKLLDFIGEGGDYEMIRFGVEVVNNDMGKSIPVLSEPLTVAWEGSSLHYMQEYTYGTCWCYLYKREVLEGRCFPLNVIVEDLLFLVPILLDGKKMIVTDTTVYYYFVRANNATSVSHSGSRLSHQSDDIAVGVKTLERFKEGQPEEIKRRLLEKQQLLVHNMSIRMILSNKNAHDVNRIVQSMTKLNLFPMSDGGTMTRLVNFVFKHLWTLPVFRVMYKLFRGIVAVRYLLSR